MKTHQDPWYDHLIDCFYDLYYKLEDLKQRLQSRHDFEDVQRNVINELKHCRDNLKNVKGNVSKEMCAEAFYIMTAYADELMIFSDYESQERWEDKTMEDLFFGSHQAGKRVYLKADELIKRYSDADLGIVVLLFLCLSLGFQGIYRYRESRKPDEIRKELHRLICSTNDDFPRNANQLFPQAYSGIKNTQIEMRSNKLVLWISGFATVVVTAAIYLSLGDLTPFYLQFHQWREWASVLWQERLFVIGVIAVLLLLTLSTRLIMTSFSPVSGVLFFRMALRRLFTLLKRNLPQTKGETVPNYVLLYADTGEQVDLDTSHGAQHRVLHSTDADLVNQHMVETDIEKQLFCGYNLFKDGVVIDLPVLGNSKLSRFLLLNYVFKRIINLKVDSRLNGLILVLPYGLFQSQDDENQQAVDRLRAKLIQSVYTQTRYLQQKSHSNLPVYLVVSDCHQMPGFDAFLQAIPEEQQGQMFGWSNPDYSANNTFEKAVSQGLHQVNQRIKEILVLFFSASNGEALNREWLTFLKAMLFMETQLTQMLKDLFMLARPVDGENILLRGVYFTGQKKLAVGAHSSCFMESLLRDKVFPERGLAKRYPMSLPQRVQSVWQNYKGEM